MMRSHDGAVDALETYSPAEEQFNSRRRTIGLFLGPLVLVALLAAPLPLAAPPHRLAAILAMMVVFWVTEALPLAITAMLGPVLAVILQVAPVTGLLGPSRLWCEGVNGPRTLSESFSPQLALPDTRTRTG